MSYGSETACHPKLCAGATVAFLTLAAQRPAQSEGWWEVLVTLQFVASDTYFMTPDLQSGSRITSQKLVAGAGVAPAEAELMRLA